MALCLNAKNGPTLHVMLPARLRPHVGVRHNASFKHGYGTSEATVIRNN